MELKFILVFWARNIAIEGITLSYVACSRELFLELFVSAITMVHYDKRIILENHKSMYIEYQTSHNSSKYSKYFRQASTPLFVCTACLHPLEWRHWLLMFPFSDLLSSSTNCVRIKDNTEHVFCSYVTDITTSAGTDLGDNYCGYRQLKIWINAVAVWLFLAHVVNGMSCNSTNNGSDSDLGKSYFPSISPQIVNVISYKLHVEESRIWTGVRSEQKIFVIYTL